MSNEKDPLRPIRVNRNEFGKLMKELAEQERKAPVCVIKKTDVRLLVDRALAEESSSLKPISTKMNREEKAKKDLRLGIYLTLSCLVVIGAIMLILLPFIY